MEEKNRCKRYYWKVVNRNVNIKYTLMMAGLLIICFLSVGVITYFVVWNNLLILPLLQQPENILRFQEKILRFLIMEFLLGSLTIMILAIILQFWILHRIFGPLHRLEKAMEEIVQGKLPEQPIIVRKGDILKKLAASFNQLVIVIKSGAKFE